MTRRLHQSIGRQRTTVVAPGARWTPLRYAQFGCDYGREDHRATGVLPLSLRDTSFNCFGQVTLQ